MLDLDQIVENKIKFYEKDIDRPFSLNGFDGTFAISCHAGIPEPLQGFLQRHFGVMRLSRIKMDKINEALNEVWEGPGSLEKVFRLEREYAKSGKDVRIMPGDVVKKKYEEEDDVTFDDEPVMTAADVWDED